VYIDYGPFLMGINRAPQAVPTTGDPGSSLWEKQRKMPWSAEAFHDESPAHPVALDAYFIDRYEVSNRDYREFMTATNHPAPAYWDDPRFNQPSQPVVGVNWFDAMAFCEYKGKRLPTEAEWEKAARGPEGWRYPWGNSLEAGKANYAKQRGAPAPVDAYPEGASYYGVQNMAGNVFEWVSDWYDPAYYLRTPVANPTGPQKPVWLGGTGTYVDRLTVGKKRVIRGGSWIAAESSISATHRFWNDPLNNSYGVGLGFRCAITAPARVKDELRILSIAAFISMGKERFQEALQYVEQGLRLSPKNEELRQIRDVIRASLKRTS
jgi:gamma-glutamyl hercynylcysteine S-oxide synthase